MATEIKIKNIPSGYQSIITNGTHTILGDEPIKSKGTDLGLAPTELVLAGLGMCKVATIRNVARRNGWEIRDVDAQLSQKVRKNEKGNLVPQVKVQLSIEGDITEEQKARLIYESDHCYVHRLIEGEWNISAAEELVKEKEILID